MTKQTYVIYIPGLGDARVNEPRSLQQQVIKTWRLWGVKPILFQVNWADSQPFAPKMERLLKLIDDCAAKGDVGLVCASAGATVALNAFTQRSQAIKGVVCIAGKINSPQSISPAYKTSAPSFWEASQQINDRLLMLGPDELMRVMSVRALADGVVPARDSILKGADNRQALTVGHAITIGTQLLFGAPFFLRFLKAQTTTKSA